MCETKQSYDELIERTPDSPHQQFIYVPPFGLEPTVVAAPVEK
jgi:hypothetical protein